VGAPSSSSSARRWWLVAVVAVVAVVAGVLGLLGGDDESASVAAGRDATSGEGGVVDDGVADDGAGDPVLVTVPQIESSGAVDVPSGLRSPEDPSHPEPLVDSARVRSGGPPPDGIPPIDDPRFEPADTVGWLEDREPVLVIDVDGEARAYPIQIMTWHELVNDTFGDRPVTVSYCPLCNSAVAYDRRLPSQDLILDFGTSGRLYNSALVMYDRQTETLWSHFTGEGILGHLTGEVLELLPVATVSWAEFRDAHPQGLVLSRETGFERDYGRNPYPGYDDVDSSPFLFDGDADPRLPAQARVVAVRGEVDSVAVVTEHLFDERSWRSRSMARSWWCCCRGGRRRVWTRAGSSMGEMSAPPACSSRSSTVSG
jgi:hypothetical protein